MRVSKNRESCGEWKYIADFQSEPKRQVESIAYIKGNTCHIFYQMISGSLFSESKITDAWITEIIQRVNEKGIVVEQPIFLHEIMFGGASLMNYYDSPNGFKQDLDLFINSIPVEQRKPHINLYSFQDEYLVPDYLLHVYIGKRLPYFIICLYWKVLVDEVAYTHYRANYDGGDFKQWKAPKYLGPCTQACYSHRHPNYLPRLEDSQELFGKSVPKMNEVVTSYVGQYVREVDTEEFWSKCVNEFPEWVKATIHNLKE